MGHIASTVQFHASKVNVFRPCSIPFKAYLQARSLADADGQREQVADLNASMAIVAFCSGETDTARQLLFEAVADPRLCPPALFIMAALGIVGRDATLTQAALGKPLGVVPARWRKRAEASASKTALQQKEDCTRAARRCIHRQTNIKTKQRG